LTSRRVTSRGHGHLRQHCAVVGHQQLPPPLDDMPLRATHVLVRDQRGVDTDSGPWVDRRRDLATYCLRGGGGADANALQSRPPIRPSLRSWHTLNPATEYQLMTRETKTIVLSSYVPRSPMSLITNELVGHNRPIYSCL